MVGTDSTLDESFLNMKIFYANLYTFGQQFEVLPEYGHFVCHLLYGQTSDAFFFELLPYVISPLPAEKDTIPLCRYPMVLAM